MRLGKILGILGCLPRTIWFNFRWLPFKQAVKLPVWLACNVRVKGMWRGGLVLRNAAFNSSHIGFHCADAVDCYGTHTILCVERGGKWIVEQDLHIGRGAIVHVKPKGTLTVGRNFAISGTTSIICSTSIRIGDDVQFSWGSLVMDSDAHKIFDVNGEWTNRPAPIVIGDRVWVAADVTLMKGTYIGSNCVVAGGSLVNRDVAEDGVVLAGRPAKPVKRIGGWQL